MWKQPHYTLGRIGSSEHRIIGPSFSSGSYLEDRCHDSGTASAVNDPNHQQWTRLWHISNQVVSYSLETYRLGCQVKPSMALVGKADKLADGIQISARTCCAADRLASAMKSQIWLDIHVGPRQRQCGEPQGRKCWKPPAGCARPSGNRSPTSGIASDSNSDPPDLNQKPLDPTCRQALTFKSHVEQVPQVWRGHGCDCGWSVIPGLYRCSGSKKLLRHH